MTVFRIHQLDPILANQIAAGEVVERPASVVKELVENSIDAGASLIQIDIEKGGARLIRITDNGKGIFKDDLALALSRHATSKIENSDDLAAIESLGFRGEALASISSVAHLSLTSRWHEAQTAFRAEAAGRDMQVTILPASLNAGTVVEVRDLFFNTPARRRFLRTEKTEFQHIENMISRLALSHPEIGFQLKHNGKLVKNLLPAHNRADTEKRIAKIAGREFLSKAVFFSVSHPLTQNNISISGWLGLGNYHRSQNDGQFVFVNGRMIRDRVINHAIREAYQGIIPPGRLAGFVIFIELEPSSIDVNVHPTKHEVRFHQGRMVHDFLIQAIRQVLAEGEELIPSHGGSQSTVAAISTPLEGTSPVAGNRTPPTFSTPATYINNSRNRSNPQSPPVNRGNLRDAAASYDQLLSSSRAQSPEFHSPDGRTVVIEGAYLLIEIKNQHWLLSLSRYLSWFVAERWQVQMSAKQVCSRPLMFPHLISIEAFLKFYQQHFAASGAIIKDRIVSNMQKLLIHLKQLGFNAVYTDGQLKQLSAPVIDFFAAEAAGANEKKQLDLFSGIDQQLIFLTAASLLIELLHQDTLEQNWPLLPRKIMASIATRPQNLSDFMVANNLFADDERSDWLNAIIEWIKNSNQDTLKSTLALSHWCLRLNHLSLQPLFQH